MYIAWVTQAVAPHDLVSLSSTLVTYASRLGRAVSRVAAPDVPAATLRLLAQLDELGPVGISRLAKADRCSQPTMSGAVQHLVEKGWATKTTNPDDARSSLVRVTTAGVGVLDDARRRIGTVVAERLEADPCHDVADVAAAVALLEHLLPSEQGVQ
jgi:DNA-binding MarR family transcriptional regulator